MLDNLEKLCNLCAPSGREGAVADFIVKELNGFAECKVDSLGNVIAKKLNGSKPKKTVMVDAHMDEVGFIVTGITDDGFIRFTPIGGVEASVMASAKVKIGKYYGTVVVPPVHFLSSDERKENISRDNLFIDIGALDKSDAEKYVNLGDTGIFCGEFAQMGQLIKARALDDRIGVAILIDMLKDENIVQFTGVFSVQEEVGTRGSAAAAFTVKPDGAVILEATTAADVMDVPDIKAVCNLGCGPAVSFMDGCALYDKKLYDYAVNCGILCQTKRAVAGGNNSGAIQRSLSGVPVIAVSTPCRYIHSPSCVADSNDIINARKLAQKLVCAMATGEIL